VTASCKYCINAEWSPRIYSKVANLWMHYTNSGQKNRVVNCEDQTPEPVLTTKSESSESGKVDAPNCPACNQPLLYSFSMVQPGPTTPVMLAMLWCVRCKHLITSQFLPLLPIAPGTEGKGPLNI
jgi:hypothetical protein